MTKRLVNILALLMLFVVVRGQNKNFMLAQQAFSERNYTGAVRYYKKALRKSDDFQKQKLIAYQIALSYFKMNDYKQAGSWFEDAIGDKTDSLKAYLYYANILSIGKRYHDAITILQKALTMSPGDSIIINRITTNGIILSQQSLDTLKMIKKVEELSSDYSDYSLGWWNNKLVFSSTRSIQFGRETDGRTGQGFSRLYYSEKDKETGRWAHPVEMPPKFNTAYNDGTFAFDPVNQIAYWTSCNEHTHLCLIYQSHFNRREKRWQRAEKASFMIEGYNYGHVSVSGNGNTLYFVSNMPGGYGGNDIWKITRKSDNQWGIPVNLGSGINSRYSEMFPSIVGDSLLFFSSEGHNSLGGLDLFFSMKTPLGFSKPINLGYPINSAADDFSLVMNESGTGGYFCSNRDVETGDDIYSFTGFPIKIIVEGTVKHENDRKSIEKAMVIFTDTKGVSDTVFTNKLGKYRIFINAFDEYRVTTLKKGYYKEERTLNTKSKELIFAPPPQKIIDILLDKTLFACGIAGSVNRRNNNKPMLGVKVRIYNKQGFSTFIRTDSSGHYYFNGLKPNMIYTIKTGKKGYFSESRVCTLPKVNKAMIFSKANGYDMDFELTALQKNTEIILSNIYYDFNKASLRETSKIELNKLASMLKETPGVIVQISAHTDTRGTIDYNLKLSAARAKAVVNYLVSKGIDRNRLIAKGYGESELLIPNATTGEEHQANRRTTFKVLDTNHQGKTIADTEGQFDTQITNDNTGLAYHIQLFASSKKLDPKIDFIKLLKKIHELRIYRVPLGKIYRYEAGDAYSYADARILQKQLSALGYKGCFVVAYYQGDKISILEAEKAEKGQKP